MESFVQKKELGQRATLCPLVPKHNGSSHVYVNLVKEFVNQAHISVEGHCYSHGTDTLLNGFNAFLSMRKCKNPG